MVNARTINGNHLVAQLLYSHPPPLGWVVVMGVAALYSFDTHSELNAVK